MASKKPLKLSETYACAQQFETGDTVHPDFIPKQMSITADGSGLMLDGDSATPGNTKLYGTDASGVKGWYAQPSGGGGGGVVSVTGPGVDNTDAANPVVNARPYKVYTALLTQSGTDAPVATVLENTLGEITWTRDGNGSYHAISSSLYTLGKTVVMCNTALTIRFDYPDVMFAVYGDATDIYVRTATNWQWDTFSDNVLTQSFGGGSYIEIRVYP